MTGLNELEQEIMRKYPYILCAVKQVKDNVMPSPQVRGRVAGGRCQLGILFKTKLYFAKYVMRTQLSFYEV
jgi:hypothetical protein